MDDKFYHGPAHGGPHFHSGPPGKRGLPGVSPTVQISELSEDGAYTITVTDAYHSESVRIPVADTDFIAERIEMWMDAHPEATTTVEDGSLTIEKLTEEAVEELKAIADESIGIGKLSAEAVEELTTIPDESIGVGKLTDAAVAELKTTPNGSVTKAKLDADLQKEVSRVVDTFADLYDTTEDEVTVLEDNSYYGSGQTVTFMKSDVDMTAQPFFQRANGDYMVPKPRNDPPESNAPLISIGETVASYVSKSDLVYGNDYGLFSTSCTNEIDCSMLSQAVLQGIDYYHSRYYAQENTIGSYIGDNQPRNTACYYQSRRAYGYTSSEQALWFAEQNRLFYIDYEKDHPCSQLRPGDLLFECDPDGDFVSWGTGNKYFNVGHVVVVLATYPTNDIILVAQAGGSHAGVLASQTQTVDGTANVCKLTYLRIGDNPTKHVFFARPNYGKEAKEPQNPVAAVTRCNTGTIGGTSAQAVNDMARVYAKTKFDKNKMYTMVARGTLPQFNTDHGQLRLYANTSATGTKAMAVAYQMDCGEEIAIPFVPSDIMDGASSFDFSAYIPDSYLAESEQRTYELKKIGIVEGLAPNATPDLLVSASAFTAESGVTVSSAYVYGDSAGLHVRISAQLNTAASSNGNITIGTIDPNIMPHRSNNYLRSCTVGTNVRPMEIAAGSGVVKVWYASGEGASANTLIDVVI